MNRDQISRSDFPSAEAGYDRPSVDAHLDAVAALAAALEARIKALEVEGGALRRQLEDLPLPAPDAPPGTPDRPEQHQTASAHEHGSDVPGSDAAEPAQQDDEVSARLVATRLALEGVEREQIREKIEATYDLEDADSLIDDVLERLA